MNVLGLLGGSAPRAEARPVPATVRFQVQDVLASARRLWLRGRLGPFPAATNGGLSDWWRRLRGKAPDDALVVHLETQVSGKVLEAELPLSADGQFEALFETDLPPSRRGWRLARNRVSARVNGSDPALTADACAVVLEPPDDSAAPVLVLLPSADTRAADGAGRLARSEAARQLGPILHRLAERPSRFYYLAAASDAEPARQAELMLAASSLGWPSGHLVLVPAERATVAAELTRTIDRLRWLFAGRADVVVVNADRALNGAFAASLAPAEDRAAVEQYLAGEREGSANGPRSLTHKTIHRPTRCGRITRYPVVFCHGMLGYSFLRMQLPASWNCFSSLRQFLDERGFHALFPQVTPTGSVAERAGQLRDQIVSWTDEPVNLIAHSMGGLDARYLISQLDMARRVRSLTTLSTPHRGSWLADWFWANYRNRVPMLLALEAMGVNVKGFSDCRLSVCRQFNAATPDAPQVKYFSFAGDVPHWRLSPVLRRSWSLLTPVEGPNDGMVSVQSARWGEYLGSICADHFAQTPDGVYVRGNEDFDPLAFCTRLVEDLARRGF